jgi:hypothetical protein
LHSSVIHILYILTMHLTYLQSLATLAPTRKCRCSHLLNSTRSPRLVRGLSPFPLAPGPTFARRTPEGDAFTPTTWGDGLLIIFLSCRIISPLSTYSYSGHHPTAAQPPYLKTRFRANESHQFAAADPAGCAIC